MQREYEVLTHLVHNDRTSQRKIAVGTGLSVGTVNFLIKRMVRKGLVKLERVNGKTLRYVITPKGMTEKTKLACRYLISSYQHITTMTEALGQVVTRQATVHGTTPQVVLYGTHNEIMDILRIASGALRLQHTEFSEPEDLFAYVADRPNGHTNILIVTWAVDDDQQVPPDVFRVNILNCM